MTADVGERLRTAWPAHRRPPGRKPWGLIASISLWLILWLAYVTTVEWAPRITVRWHERVDVDIEVQRGLASPHFEGGTTWSYALLDSSPANVHSLVVDPAIEDTNGLDRRGFRVEPDAPRGPDRAWAASRIPALRRQPWLTGLLVGGLFAVVGAFLVREVVQRVFLPLGHLLDRVVLRIRDAMAMPLRPDQHAATGGRRSRPAVALLSRPGDFSSFIGAIWGAAIGVLAALLVTLSVVSGPDRAPEDPLAEVEKRYAVSEMLPQWAENKVPEPREQSFFAFVLLAGPIGAYFGSRALARRVVRPRHIGATLLLPVAVNVVVRQVLALDVFMSFGLSVTSWLALAGWLGRRSRSSMSEAAQRFLGGVALALVAIACGYVLTGAFAPRILVQWSSIVTDRQRESVEDRLKLARPHALEGNLWAYDLLDDSRRNLVALVHAPEIEGTDGINRETFVVSAVASRGRSTTWSLHRVPGLNRHAGAVEWFPMLLMTTCGAWLLSRRVFQERGGSVG